VVENHELVRTEQLVEKKNPKKYEEKGIFFLDFVKQNNVNILRSLNFSHYFT